MKFRTVEARENWKDVARQLGFFATLFDDPPYWVEAIEQPFCAVFSIDEIEELIIPATVELNRLALEAVHYVCTSPESDSILQRMKIPQAYWKAIRASWTQGSPSLYGRMDFAYSNGELKLLELNFDTASALYESAVFQSIWFSDLVSSGQIEVNCGQFNRIHEQLFAAFSSLSKRMPDMHFTCAAGFEEDEETTKYLQSCARLAGLNSKFLYLHDLGFDETGRLIDLSGGEITTLFKLYAWEKFIEDDELIEKQTGKSTLRPIIEEGRTTFFEPAWKIILSNKGILPVLWKLAPDCRWLLESYFSDSDDAARLVNKPHARKPIFGRQGLNISLIYPDDYAKGVDTSGNYGKEGYVLQSIHPLAKHEDYHILLGSWTVCGQASGIGIRAELSPITSGRNCLFVPHYVEG